MRPLTARRPKVMLPVAGKPLMEHLLVRSVEAGFGEFVVLTHYQEEAVRKHFGTGKKWGAKIRYVHQASALGTGHALAELKDHQKEANGSLLAVVKEQHEMRGAVGMLKVLVGLTFAGVGAGAALAGVILVLVRQG